MKVNIVLFDDFDLLEAFGIAGIFEKIPEHYSINYVSVKGDFINSMQGCKIWTEPLDSEQSCDAIVIPGGRGAKKVMGQQDTDRNVIKKAVENADNCLMIGSGSGVVAQTGLLFRRNIVDCARYKSWNQMFTAGIYRINDVDWVADGKYYSARTMKSSLDMTLSYIADAVDVAVADTIAEEMGHSWNNYENEDYIF